jgi:ribosomal protein S18 acetylase RimI-like enzyme
MLLRPPEALTSAIVVHLQMVLPSELQIHCLGHDDLPRVEQHLLALGEMDRRARFGTAIRDLGISAYVRRVDPSRAIMIGAVDGRSGHIVGLAEAQPSMTPQRVEMAVSVLPDFRRHGIGQRLLRQAVAGAFETGIEVAEFFFSPDNRPVIGLVRKLGARIAATFDRAEILYASPYRNAPA